MISPWDMSRADLAERLVDQPSYRVNQVWHGLYELGLSPSELTELPASLKAKLAEDIGPVMTATDSRSTSDGLTVKKLWTSGTDQAAVESVLMHYPDRSTVCISSQAGCAMGCGFCATGQAGYERNLTVGEILEQVISARLDARPRRLSNVVFMGMGEPFANYDRVMISIRRIIEDLGIGARRITVSTVGLVPQMLRFAEERLQVGLAVSLHAANDQLRTELVPINKRHPIDDVVAAAQLYRERTGRRVSFEWAMIDNVNDRPSDARELADVARRASAHVNLIPLNPTPGWPTVGTPLKRVAAFRDQLVDAGVNATVRANRGTDIDAACGQLRATSSSNVTIGKTR
jgi:23S rRNA (adenine2503-C2)-methyltransferase